MSHHHAPQTGTTIETAIEPASGWHVCHFFYSFDRNRLAARHSIRLARRLPAGSRPGWSRDTRPTSR